MIKCTWLHNKMEVITLNTVLRDELVSKAKIVPVTFPLVLNAYKNVDCKPFDVVTCIPRKGDNILVSMFVTAASTEEALHRFTNHLRSSSRLNLCLVHTPQTGFLEPGINEYVQDMCCSKTLHAFVSKVVSL